ncbi:MAG: SUMF1/EgtB/PvdO family nonheme iron enzyme [Spirochaetia bacterium]|nr:SUMF1/EgtB/PvdO family nonheme iron enzyme [Spirochaetia bacterium]
MLKKKSAPDSTEVKLRPILGIRPGYYLFALYSLIIILVIYFFMFRPGIKNNGTLITFTSEPENIPVWMDSTYVGTTPCREFIPAGEHTFSFRHTGFRQEDITADVKGRIFASKFFPRKDKISVKMSMSDPDSLFQTSFREFSSWGLINSFSSSYRPEPVLLNTVKALSNSNHDRAQTEKFLLESMKNIFSEELLSDFIAAYTSFHADNMVLTPGALAAASDGIYTLIRKNPLILVHLITSLSSDNAVAVHNKLKTTDALKKYASTLGTTVENSDKKNISACGMELLNVPEGTYMLGNPSLRDDQWMTATENDPAPYSMHIKEFYISHQITAAEYEQFRHTSTETNAGQAVRDVTYQDAMDYCTWLNGKLPAELRDKYYFRLPDEYEWEAFARIYHDSQDVWDWCCNWYYPAGTFYADIMTDDFDGIQKVVRGGKNVWTRGSQPPEWHTPFLGFRVALVRK